MTPVREKRELSISQRGKHALLRPSTLGVVWVQYLLLQSLLRQTKLKIRIGKILCHKCTAISQYDVYYLEL